MDFKIIDIKFFKSQTNSSLIDKILYKYNTDIKDIQIALQNFTFTRKNKKEGLQIQLANKLEILFKNLFEKKGFHVFLSGKEIRYSPIVDLRADVVVKDLKNKKGIFIEIEFRPNECKDIIKFEIGRKNGLNELGIMVVAQNRNNINLGYTTMPEFNKCKKILKEYNTKSPILLIGIDGKLS